ncbi:MAG TPA: response regulator [Ktedonobacteraceae bacterium]|nr:response regulator [Ktedonobacteraceae bacterium]
MVSQTEPLTVKTVLIVEDSTDIGQFLLQIIQEETVFQPLLVTDGFQALKVVQQVKPALLLLDYGLPVMNGLQLFDQLHSTATFAHLPTILMTANDRFQQSELDSRHILLLKKPFEIDELLTAINSLIP